MKRDDGVRVESFVPLHGQPMHLIATTFDMEDLQHVHPTLRSDGLLSVDLAINRPSPLALFAEFAPAGDGAWLRSRGELPGWQRPSWRGTTRPRRV